MDLKIIFENDLFLVLDKPAPLTVNRAETTREETLQDQLAKYFKLASDDLGIGDRAGIVHRLDRETSGVLVVAKEQETFDVLQEEFRNRRVRKEYVALVHGFMKENSGTVASRIARIGKFGKFGNLNMRQVGGKEAETGFERVSSYQYPVSSLEKIAQDSSYNKSRIRYLQKNALDYSLLSVFPKTGRTHQIRVHLKSIGHPVVSDLIYAPGKLLKFDLMWCPRLFLHAQKIEFTLTTKGKAQEFVFEAPLSYDLEEAKKFLVELPHEPS